MTINLKHEAMSYIPDNERYENRTCYRRCGRSGIKLPEISLGLWHNFGGVDVLENGRAMLRYAFDQGITHFDLANNYGPPPGSAEENFGTIFYCLDCICSKRSNSSSTKKEIIRVTGLSHAN